MPLSNPPATSGPTNLFQGTNTVEIRAGTTAQSLLTFETFADASNYSRLRSGFNPGSLVFEVFSESAGTGVVRGFAFGTTGAQNLYLATTSTYRWKVQYDGMFLAQVDNTLDIGASGASRPRNIFAGSAVQAGTYLQSGSTTVAGLPAAAAANIGARHFVTDATATTFLSTVAGGGTNKVPVVSNGSSWLIG